MFLAGKDCGLYVFKDHSVGCINSRLQRPGVGARCLFRGDGMRRRSHVLERGRRLPVKKERGYWLNGTLVWVQVSSHVAVLCKQ